MPAPKATVLCDQPGCAEPATRIATVVSRNTGVKSWYSCVAHSPVERCTHPPGFRCGVCHPENFVKTPVIRGLSECAFVVDDGGRADAGFKGGTGDCVTRAIAIATGLPYRQVYDDLNALAESMPRRGASRKRDAAVQTKPSSRTGHHRKVYERYLADIGWEWTPTMSIGSGTTVHLRADELPAGRLVVRCSKHLVAVIDGIIHDTFDPSRAGTRAVYGYFQIGDTR